MKKIRLNQLVNLFILVISILSFSCKSIAYDYCKDDDIDSNSKEIFEKAIKIDSNQIALILSGESFKDNKLIIFSKNRIDTIKGLNSNEFDQPEIVKKFRKDEKIKLKHNGSSIKIKVKPEYRYIEIRKYKNNWSVTYCNYPLIYPSF